MFTLTKASLQRTICFLLGLSAGPLFAVDALSLRGEKGQDGILLRFPASVVVGGKMEVPSRFLLYRSQNLRTWELLSGNPQANPGENEIRVTVPTAESSYFYRVAAILDGTTLYASSTEPFGYEQVFHDTLAQL